MSKRVCVLLTDDTLVDYRVVYEATSLADAGYVVRIIMPTQRDKDYVEQVNGFEVCYVRQLAPTRRLLLQSARSRSWRKTFDIFTSAYEKQVAQSEGDQSLSDSASGSAETIEQKPRVWARFKKKVPPPVKKRIWAAEKALLNFCLNAPSLTGVIAEFNLLLTEVAFARKAREFQPDIIHAHDLQTLRLGRVLAKELNARLVYDAHEFFPFQGYIKHAMKFWLKRERADIHAPDIVITVNPPLARIMEKFYGVEKIHVIHNTVPYEDHHASRETSRTRLTSGLSLPNERCCVLLYLGNVPFGRNLLELVEAVALLPDYYVLAIMGDGHARPEMEQHVKDLHLERRIVFHGMLPREQVPVLVVGADIGLFTMKPGGVHDEYVSTNRLGDYVVAGLPMAMTDLPYLRWFVEHYQCGVLFDSNDPHDIAQKIRWLFDDQRRFEEFRQNTLEAGKQYNWDVESRKFLELYASLN